MNHAAYAIVPGLLGYAPSVSDHNSTMVSFGYQLVRA